MKSISNEIEKINQKQLNIIDEYGYLTTGIDNDISYFKNDVDKSNDKSINNNVSLINSSNHGGHLNFSIIESYLFIK